MSDSRCTFGMVLCDRTGIARPDLAGRVICDRHLTVARVAAATNPRRARVDAILDGVKAAS